MKTKLIRISDITAERLKEISALLRFPQNSLVSRALNFYLDNEKYHEPVEMQKLIKKQ
jgi:hypothetical protein